MNHPGPSFSVEVDVTNPGHFFACCGLLKLAHRLWPGAEGRFGRNTSMFVISAGSDAQRCLFRKLRDCDISVLSKAEREEKNTLANEKRRSRKLDQEFPQDKEARRKSLDNKDRKGNIQIGEPFGLTLNWWQTDDDLKRLKTWAGQQRPGMIASAAQKTLPVVSSTSVLNYGDVLLAPDKSHRKVEPFYFDARRFAHALDTGFSLDVQDAETIAHPAVELLCLIGLQRFRPMPSSTRIRHFEYQTWPKRLGVPIAAAVASCGTTMPGSKRYLFKLDFRDDQKRYKSFGFSKRIGDDS